MNVKRPRCEVCQNPKARCLCEYAKQIENRIEVIIWQHPSETHHPKGTAKLLRKCLQRSRIVSGESISEKDLGVNLDCCALLYPNDSNASPQGTLKPLKQLLVLDGTWRKSRKLMYTNPWLNTLPRFSLNKHLSRYSIRKAERPQQLSTFEAATFALQTLENNSAYVDLQDQVFKPYVAHLAHLAQRKSR